MTCKIDCMLLIGTEYNTASIDLNQRIYESKTYGNKSIDIDWEIMK